MKFSRKMCLIIILKVPKKQGITSSVENTVLKKPQREVKLTPAAFIGLRKRYIIDVWQGSEYSSGSEYIRILNMPGLHKVLKKMLHHRCLTGSRIFVRFWIWQGSRYSRITQGSEQNTMTGLQRVVNSVHTYSRHSWYSGYASGFLISGILIC